jgi:prolyl oligopeptidase
MPDPMCPAHRPPAAWVDVVRETQFGITTADPYRWMEDEGAELYEWLAEQGEYAGSVLAELPDRAELLARIRELTAGTPHDPAFTLAGDRVFCLRQAPEAQVPTLIVRDDAGERILLDPADLPGPVGSQPGSEHDHSGPEHSRSGSGHSRSGSGHSHLDWFVPSPDGRYVACGISRGGSENSTLRIVETDTGTLRPDAIGGTFHGAVSWVPGTDSLICHRYLAPAAGTLPSQRRHDSRASLHRLGTPADSDVMVLARGLNDRVPLAPIDRPFVFTPSGSDWMIAVISHSALAGSLSEQLSDCSLYVAPRAALADPGSCPWRKVAGPSDGVTAYAVHADTLYLVTYRGAPRSHVVSVPLAEPDLTAGTVVVAGGERAVVAVKVVGTHLLVHERDAGTSRLRRVPLAGGAAQEIPLPIDGAIDWWTGHPSQARALLSLNSWTQSARVYRYDELTGAVTDTGWLPPSAADFGGIETTSAEVPTRDGTLIPLRVIHRTGLVLDGSNPALLTGYGSYGFVPRHLFAPEMLAWYERGGVYAVAGLRGGGEYGREWHEAGHGPRKENTITDYIDCAEYLISAGYTGPRRLAGHGVSAGGIPSGGALVRRPDLWAAMVMAVPATNATRQEFSENGPINVPEHGSVSTEAGLRDLLITDCYLRVKDGTRYPAVLIMAGLNDPRVAIWQPAKMAARLQAASTSGRPVLLRIDPHAGHGFGSTQAQRDELTADLLSFLLHSLDTDTDTDTDAVADTEP